MDIRFDRDGYPPGHPAYDPNNPRSVKPILFGKRMKKQNTINPAIANDPNDPLKRIIRREETQTQSGSGNNDYISPERFARRKGYLPGGIKRPRRTPTQEGQLPGGIVNRRIRPWPGNEGWRTLPQSPFYKPKVTRMRKSHTPKHFLEQLKNYPTNFVNSYIESKRKKDADFWADKAGYMEGRNAKGGMVYEEVPATLRQPGMRRSLFGDNIIALRTHEGYTDNKIPRGLVQGRKFWGESGGRSSRGVGTAKRMNKSTHKESKWEKDVARLVQIFDPRAFMNRDRLGVVEETNIFGIPYTGARTMGPSRSSLFPQLRHKNYIGSAPTKGSMAIKSLNNINKRAIPTQRTDNTRKKYGI
jgi:hypothetical protein